MPTAHNKPSQAITILVCGGRDYSDRDAFVAGMDLALELNVVSRPGQIIQGGARGADSLAKEWAVRQGVPCREFPADWKQYGKAAGQIRNAQMLNEGRPDLVIAFPGGRGTANMVARARNAGVAVVEFLSWDGGKWSVGQDDAD